MSNRVLIIAEAGVNHNGSLELAKKMVDAAVEAGADIIKFQTFVASQAISKWAPKADYQNRNQPESNSQLEMVRKLELSFDNFKELNAYCQEKGIEFLSTPFDFDSIHFLETLDMKRWKIPSGEITNLPYLIQVARQKKPILLSTGMCTVDEIRDAISILKANGAQDLSVLHCTTEYPAPYSEVNLNAMMKMGELFDLAVGYSDHTEGIEIAIAATALGATVIEKHFTLDRQMDGPDHIASLEPHTFKAMVTAIRHVETALGSAEKIPTASEIKNMAVARKSLVAKRNIKKGECFSEENLTVKRPGTGISPMKWFEVLGKTANRDFQEDELIEL